MAAPDPATLLCSVDGDVVPVGQATISIMDEGLIRGDGAFEMLKLYDNRPFGLVDHLDRLDRSACKGTMSDLAPAGGTKPAYFTDGVMREVVVKKEATFELTLFEIVNELLVFLCAKSGCHQSLGFTASK